MEVSIGVAIWNIYKACIFQGWLNQSFLLESSAFILNVRFAVKSDLQFPYSGHMLLQFTISFSLISAYLRNGNYKPAYLKTECLWKCQFYTSFSSVCLLSFSELWRAENAMFAYRKYILNNFGCLEISILFVVRNI